MNWVDVKPWLPRERSDALWRRLAGARIFVTGGTGLFGLWLLQSLEDANRRLGLDISVLLLSRQPENFQAGWICRHTRIRCMRGDVRCFEAVPERFDAVLHMASTSAGETYRGFSQLEKFDILETGTRRVLDYAEASGARRLLFTSSGAAYGQTPNGPVAETELSRLDPCLPESALGLGKVAAEFLCARYAETSDLQPVIARCFSFVGPGLPLDLHYALGNFLRDAVHGRPITVRGDGNPLRSYLYLGDLVVWLLTLLLDGNAGEVYNVGSDEAISMADLARKVAALATPIVPVHILGDATHQVGVPVRNVYVPAIYKARQTMGLKVETGLDSALAITLAQLCSGR